MNTPDSQDSEALYDDGLAAYRDQRYEDALQIADQLEERRYSGAFEVRALALNGQGETEEAVTCLEAGIEKAPGVWLLWQLLGNYRSDLERYDEAEAAYEAALGCPEVDEASVLLNQAVLLGRLERPEAALEKLDAITDPAYRLRSASVRLGDLLDLERYEEARTLGEAALEWDAGDLEAEQDATGLILCYLARTASALGEDPTTVRALALEGVAHDPTSGATLYILRDLDPQWSDDARLWNIGMDGRDDRLPGVGFYVWTQVVADTAYEAFELAREIEEAVGFDALELDETEEDEARPDLPKGVYHRGLRHAYESDE